MAELPAADKVIDCVGAYCPVPLVQTSRALKELELGQVLELVASDEDVKVDIPIWCRKTGNECLGISEEDGEYRVFVRRRK